MKTVVVKYVPLAQRLVKRFIKTFVAAAVASVIVVPPLQGLDRTSLDMFAVAVFNGAWTGVLIAFEKWANETK